MARAIWSGSISFGLVSVPVKAYSATKDHKVHFHELDRSGNRVQHQKVSSTSGRKVEEIKLGYETSNGKYVTFDRAELDELRPASTRTVDVADFVDLDDIDPIYYQRTYWLAPDGDAARKAYSLLVAAMDKQQKVGIGSVVMRNKQYLAALRPLDGALAMSTMRFADEVVAKSKVEAIPSRATKPQPKEMKLAEQIIDSLSSDWDPKRYRDTYTDQLRDIIGRKAKGKKVEVAEEAEPSADVLDLMAALEQSVTKAKSTRRRTTASRGNPKNANPKKAKSTARKSA